MIKRAKQSRCGFTLIELAVVVAILSIIAWFAVSRVADVARQARIIAAEHDLKTICEAFVDPVSGYLKDMRGIPDFSVGFLRVANLLISTNLYHEAGRVDHTALTHWDAEAEHGWNGPYIKHTAGWFPSAQGVRFMDDASFEERGFFPPLSGLREPHDFINRRWGSSIYGFPGEPAVIDPWGNPYVLQIPPAQAFRGANTNLPDEVRFRYARVVSAGPDGRLDTPCFAINLTNRWATTWTAETRRKSRQAGRIGVDVSARGDDLVMFLLRNDVDEGEDGE